MIWSQVYNPLGNTILSTLVCAIPVLVLLGGLGIFHIRAHYAAIAGLVAAVVIALFVIGMPTETCCRCKLLRRAVRDHDHLLDHPEPDFPVPDDPQGGVVQDPAGQHRWHHQRPQAAAGPDRILLRRVFRRRGGWRYAGGRDRRDPDRARIQSAGGLRPVADCQYRAGGLRRTRNADHRPAFGYPAGKSGLSAHAFRHGGTATPLLFRDRPDLAGVDVLRLAPHGGSLAGGSGRGPVVCNSAIRDLELPRSVAGGHARCDDLDGHPCRVPRLLETEVGHAGCFRKRESRCPGPKPRRSITDTAATW